MAEESSAWSLSEREDPIVRQQSPAAKRRIWRWRLLAVTISSAFSILLAIAFFQYRDRASLYMRHPNPESGIVLIYDPLLGWRNVPHHKSTTFGKKLTINSRGLRDREHPVEKPAGASRILVLGDSFAWGWGVADDEVFPHVLEELLIGSHSQWEVINTGVTGWGTDQEYLYLKNEGFDYSPDVVVVAVFTGNDPLDNARSKPYQRFKPVFLNTELQLANVPVPKPSEQKAEIWTRANEIELTGAIVTRMAVECAARKCPLVVMKFGMYIEPNNPRFLAVDAHLASVLTEHSSVRYFDLDRQFAKQGLTYRKLCGGNRRAHWNATGHRAAARMLYRFLVDEGLLGATGNHEANRRLSEIP